MEKHRYAEFLAEHYRPLIREHASSYRAVDWSSKTSQFARFAVLTEIGDIHGASILDVGCGVGHFVDYLEATGWDGSYLGLDAVPEMVDVARARHPQRRFEVGFPTRDHEEHAVDYVFASGAFAFADRDVMCETIAEMFAIARRACGFNVLSLWAPDRFPGEVQHDPLAVLEFCHHLTPWVTLRHDYLVHDMTVFMYRERQLR